MTVDLFAASFICRDAELGAVIDFGSSERTVRTGWSEAWAILRAALAGLIRRSPAA